MSPYEIGILLHYYCRAVDHDDMERNPPVWRPTIEAFKAEGLIEQAEDDAPRFYRLTGRGHYFVQEGLCRLPLPVQRWEIPVEPK